MCKLKLLFCIVSLFFSTFCLNAAVIKGECGDNLTYAFDDDTDILTIMGTGDMTNYASADAVPWSKLVGDIKKVDIKTGVTSIGDYAFYGCELLWNVQIPTTVTRIGSYAFAACLYLFDTELSENVTTIGDYAFRGCTYFSKFTIPENATSLGVGIFYGCNSLEAVTIKAPLMTIPNNTFAYCNVLKDIQMPKTVKSIGSSAFYDCDGLTAVVIPDSVTSIGESAFQDCSALKTIVFPDTLKTLGVYAFRDCRSLGNITLPEGLTTIGHSCFQGCKAFTKIDIPSSVSRIENYTFHSCSALSRIGLHNGLQYLGYQCFIYCSSLDSVVIPRSVSSMSSYVFHSNTNLTTVVLPEGLATVPEYTFTNCYALKNVYLPNTITNIETAAFQNCTTLTVINLPPSVCSINGYAFNGDKNLDTIRINRLKEPLVLLSSSALTKVPDTVKIIVPCSRVDDYKKADVWSGYADNIVADAMPFQVTVGANNKDWGTVNQSGLICSFDDFLDTLYATPAKNCRFNGWSNGETANPLVVTVTSDAVISAIFAKIEDSGACGPNVKWEYDNAGILRLVGSGPISDYASKKSPWYAYRESIKQVVIDSSVTAIGKYAFEDCDNLERIDLPTNVSAIAASAFQGCSALKIVTIAHTNAVVTVGVDAFDGVHDALKVYVPCGMVGGYQSSSNWASLSEIVVSVAGLYKVTASTNNSLWGSVAIVGSSCVDNIVFDTLVATPKEGFFSHWADDVHNNSAVRVVPVVGDFAYKAVFAGKIEDGQCGDNLYWELDANGYLVIRGTGKMYDYSIAQKAPWYKYADQINAVFVNEGATSIGNYAFYSCPSISKVALPASLTAIGNYAFYSCMDLKNVDLPSQLKTLGNYAFSSCASLKSILIPASVTSIGSYAFYGCTLMEKAVVRASIKALPQYMFCHCNALTDVEIPDDLTSIGNYAFYRCYQLPNFAIPSTVTSIGSYAFASCVSFTEVQLPERLGSLGSYALAYCSKLTEVELPKNITVLNDYLFTGCTNLKKVEVPAVTTAFNTGCFYNCTSLTDVNFPDALASIGTNAFRNCSTLTKVVMSPNVQSIGESSFQGCANLKTVSLSKSLVTIGKNAFNGDTSLVRFAVPAKVLLIGETAFYGCSKLDTLQIQRFDDALTILGTNGLQNTPSSLKVFVPCSRVDDYVNLASWAAHKNKFVSDLQLYNVKLVANIDSLGVVEHSGAFCYENTVADSVYAKPVGDAAFLYWSDGVTSNPRFVSLVSDTTFKAVFVGIVGNGKCGEDLYWKLDTRGILTITGTGKMYDYTAGMASWYGNASSIKKLEVTEGVATLGANAFYGCKALTDVELSSSVSNIGKSAFEGCSALQTITCAGSTVATLEKDALKNTPKTLDIFVNCGLLEKYQKEWSVVASQIKSFADFYTISVSTNDAELGSAALEDLICKDNKLEATVKASVIDDNRFSFWSDDEDAEDSVRVLTVQSDTAITAVFARVIAEGQCGAKLFWNFDSQGKLTVYGTGNMYNFSSSSPAGWSLYADKIRKVVVEEGATTIGNNAFYACSQLRKVVLPPTLLTLGSNSFNGCVALKHITLPEGLKTISSQAFYGCSALEEIVVPQSVTTMGTYVFSLCGSLKTAVINAEIKTLDSYMFSSCASLDSILLPETLTKINSYAFSGCRSLESIVIPASVQEFGTYAFNSCVRLKEFNIPYGMLSIPNACFYNCTALESVVIPPTVKSIGSSAFSACSSLDNLVLPYSVASMGSQCFRTCKSLSSVVIPGGVTVLSEYIFENCTNLRKVEIPNTVATIQQYAFSSCSTLTKVAIPSSVTTIGSFAFGSCPKLDTFMVRRYQDPLTVLSSNGLYRAPATMNVYAPCSRYDGYLVEPSWSPYAKRMYMESFLYKIALYPNYKSRGSARVTGTGCSDSVSVDTIKAFNRGCGRFQKWSDGVVDNPRVLRVTSDSLLEAIFLADTVHFGKIGDLNWTLYCDSLLVIDGKGAMTDFKNPESVPWYQHRNKIVYADVRPGVTSIGKNAFNGDTLLLGITLPKTLTEIHDYAFADCVVMDTITIPSAVESVGDYAFARSGLSFVVMPAGVKSWGKGMFSNCTSLSTVVLPEGRTSLADELFLGCTSLHNVALPSSLTSINNKAFKGCTAIDAVNLPGNLETIGAEAFAECANLGKLTLPDAVLSIGDKAFFACDTLDTVECLRLQKPIPAIGKQVFDNGANSRKIYVDCNMLQDYRKADSWKVYNSAISTYGLVFTATLSVSADTAGTVELTYTKCSEAGTVDSILATPIGCHRFLRWSDGVTANPRCLVLDKDTSITAIFRVGYIDRGGCGDNMEWEISCDSVLLLTGKGAMANYSATSPSPWTPYADLIKAVKVDDGITAIGNYAFRNVAKLSTVEMPASVALIGSSAFADCRQLRAVRLNASKVTVVDSSTFFNVSKYFAVYVPCVLQDDYAQHHGWKDYVGVINPLKVPFNIQLVAVDDTLGEVTSSSLDCIDSPTVVSLTAKPFKGSIFVKWDDGSKEKLRDVTVVSDTVIKAYFAPDTFLVTAVGVDALGTVKGAGRYPYAHKASLIPEPKKGYHFVKWSTGSTKAKLDTVVYGNVDVKAYFAIDTCRLTLLAEGNGQVVEAGTGVYLYGQTAEVEAVADPYHHLVDWSNGLKDVILNVKMVRDTQLVARFAVDSFEVSAVTAAGLGAASGVGLYPYGTKASVTAVPDYGYHFTGWADGNKKATIDTVVTRDIVLEPSFAINTYDLTLSSNEFGRVMGAGNYEFKSEVPITAIPIEGHHFVMWSNGSRQAEDTVVLVSDSAISAVFAIDTFKVAVIAENGSVMGTGTYVYNQECVLEAVPAEGHHFVRWLNGGTGLKNSFSVQSDTTLTALFAIDTFMVDITAVHGSVTGAGSYVYDEEVTVTAVPDEHYHFLKWSNGKLYPEFSFFIHSDVQLEAFFGIDSFKVDIADADHVRGDAAGYYAYTDTLVVTAVPAEGYHFVKWSTGDSTATLRYVVKSDVELTPYFAVDSFWIEVLADNGDVTGAGRYAYGETAEVEAIPNEGYHFVSWNNGVSDATFSFTVKKGDTLVATFELDSFFVELDETITKGDKEGYYHYGDTVKVSAVVPNGYHFKKWNTGAITQSIEARIVSDTVLTPLFEADSFYVDAVAVNGKVKGVGRYKNGENVRLEAVPNKGYHFVKWENGTLDAVITFDVAWNVIFKAYFELDTFWVDVDDDFVEGPSSGFYKYGDSLSFVLKEIKEGHHFAGWSNGVKDSTFVVKLESDTAVSPVFLPDTFKVVFGGKYPVKGAKTGLYPYGKKLHLEASPVKGHHFVEWSTGQTSLAIDFIVTGADSVYPIFAPDMFNIDAVCKNGAIVGLGSYAYGDTVRLTAKPDAYYKLESWHYQGEKDSVIKIVVEGDLTLYPTFMEDPSWIFDVYNVNGKLCKRHVVRTNALEGLPQGVYFLRNSHRVLKLLKRGAILDAY